MPSTVRRLVRTPVALVVLAALFAATLVACGGGDDGPRLSRAAYTKQANTECTKLKRASDDLLQAQSPGATGKNVSDYLSKAADGLAALSSGLDSLAPPDAIADDAAALGEALGAYGEGLQQLADNVKDDETFADALNSNQKLVRSLNDIAERATKLVAKLGIDGCQLAA